MMDGLKPYYAWVWSMTASYGGKIYGTSKYDAEQRLREDIDEIMIVEAIGV
jgi:hypothetical protein